MKLTVFYLINPKKKITIILDTPLLKMVEGDEVALVVLADLVVQIFQTFLRIFLVILEVVEEVLEQKILTIEVQI